MRTVKKFAYWTERLDFFLQPEFQDVYCLKDQDVISNSVQIEVLAIDIEKLDILEKNIELYLACQKIIFVSSSDSEIQTRLISQRMPDFIVPKSEFGFHFFLQAQEQMNQLAQDQLYLSIVSDLNIEYEKLKSELEKKVYKANLHLIESRQKILESNNKNAILRKILYALHQEDSLEKCELILNQLVPSASAAVWIKIVPIAEQPQFLSDFKSQLDVKYECYNLISGWIYFIKGDQKNYKKTDIDLFLKIKDALFLNLKRQKNLNDLSLADKISELAFETFHQPLALINESYDIININQKYDSQKKCYQALFNRLEPCLSCSRGDKFQVTNEGRSFDVTSNLISGKAFGAHNQKIWSHIYKDRTQQISIEKRLNENVKMKDLGLISSSIAHELNNPLGGIISYLQILQMEIPQSSPVQNDLQLMLKSSEKMKNIIQDLLVFSRRPDLLKPTFCSVFDIIKESLDSLEILLRSQNIKVINKLINPENLNPKSEKIEIWAQKNIFRESIQLIFDFCIQNLNLIQKNKPQFSGLIEIQLIQDQLKNRLCFTGNFGPLDEDFKLKNIHFLSIHKSLLDQGFHVELTEPNKTWVDISIHFQKS